MTCNYAFEAGVRQQQAAEQSLRSDLRRPQSEADGERERREILQNDLQHAQWMVQQEQDQHQVQQAQLNEAHTRTKNLQEYQQTLLEHLHAAHADILQARTVVQQQRDQYRNLQHEAQVVIESQQDTHRILRKGIENTQADLLKLSSLLNSFRSQPESKAESLLKNLRQGQYDWTLIETLGWRRDRNAHKPYPWHDWRSIDRHTTKDPASSSAGSTVDQHAKARSSAGGTCSSDPPGFQIEKQFADSLPTPLTETSRSSWEVDLSRTAQNPVTEAMGPPTKKRSLDGGTAQSIYPPSHNSERSLPSLTIESLLAPMPRTRKLPQLPCIKLSGESLGTLNHGPMHSHDTMQIDHAPTISHPEFDVAVFATANT